MRGTMRINIHDIWISPGHDFRGGRESYRMKHAMKRVDEVVCDAGLGLAGDRYHGERPGSKTQVTFISRDVLESMCRALGIDDLDYALLRRNILVSGVDLNWLIGKTFAIDGVVFEGVEECKPCYWMDKTVKPGALSFLVGRGGLRCRILTGGTLRCHETNLLTG